MKTKQTKRAFILSQPRTLPASDVVKKGKAKGLIFSAGYVYVTRFNGKGEKPEKTKQEMKALIRNVLDANAKLQQAITALLKFRRSL